MSIQVNQATIDELNGLLASFSQQLILSQQQVVSYTALVDDFTAIIAALQATPDAPAS